MQGTRTRPRACTDGHRSRGGHRRLGTTVDGCLDVGLDLVQGAQRGLELLLQALAVLVRRVELVLEQVQRVDGRLDLVLELPVALIELRREEEGGERSRARVGE